MAIELLAPAGNYEKLETAFSFGADAAYMGLSSYSMRAKADNFTLEELEKVRALKQRTGKRVYCTMNILFSEDQIHDVEALLPLLKDSPFDAFIISDMGLVDLMRRHLPDKDLHLSTQASCLNSSAAKLYHSSLGFKRVILGREATLDDIRRIKDAVPELELEAFVHGAMCMAYSGRCLLSSHLAGRSGNQGECAHTCRWRYRLSYALEEEERPGVYYPIEEDEGFTTILSSKDLCMIDHLDELVASGLSSLKIEGRMKSVMYIAQVVRAYRKALDKDPEWRLWRDDLFNVSHREFSTGFFFGHDAIDAKGIDHPTSYGYERQYLYLGTVGRQLEEGLWEVDVRNQIRKGEAVEYIGPDVYRIVDEGFSLLDADGNEVDKLDHGKAGFIRTDKALHEGYIIRGESGIKRIN